MQARRQKRRCLKCYRFEPHTHFERLKGLGGRPKTIWFVDMGDLFGEWVLRILEAARRYPGNTYMFLTKNPRRYHEFLDMFPENSLLGATIETNRDTSNLSKAPSPVERFEAMLELNHPHKFVVVEPILDILYTDPRVYSTFPKK